MLVAKPDGKRLCRRYSSRWEDSTTMYLKEIRREVVSRIHTAQNRLVMGSCEHGNELSGSIQGGIFLD
jgi:hypothetical protein